MEHVARDGAAYAPDTPGAAVPGEPLLAGPVSGALRGVARRRHKAGGGRWAGGAAGERPTAPRVSHFVSIVNAGQGAAHINNDVVTLDLASSHRDADARQTPAPASVCRRSWKQSGMRAVSGSDSRAAAVR